MIQIQIWICQDHTTNVSSVSAHLFLCCFAVCWTAVYDAKDIPLLAWKYTLHSIQLVIVSTTCVCIYIYIWPWICFIRCHLLNHNSTYSAQKGNCPHNKHQALHIKSISIPIDNRIVFILLQKKMHIAQKKQCDCRHYIISVIENFTRIMSIIYR